MFRSDLDYESSSVTSEGTYKDPLKEEHEGNMRTEESRVLDDIWRNAQIVEQQKYRS